MTSLARGPAVTVTVTDHECIGLTHEVKMLVDSRVSGLMIADVPAPLPLRSYY